MERRVLLCAWFACKYGKDLGQSALRRPFLCRSASHASHNFWLVCVKTSWQSCGSLKRSLPMAASTVSFGGHRRSTPVAIPKSFGLEAATQGHRQGKTLMPQNVVAYSGWSDSFLS